MITVEELIGGRTDVYAIDKKKENIAIFIEKVVDPLEQKGYDIKLVTGLLRNTEYIHIDDPGLCGDHVMGYGADITTGDTTKDDEIFAILSNMTTTSLKRYGSYIHVAYDNDYIETETRKLKVARDEADNHVTE